MLSQMISKRLLFIQLFIGVLGLSIGSFIGLSQLLDSYSGKIFKHTSICGIDVSSATSEEAASRILQQYIEPLLKKELIFDYKGAKEAVPFEQFINSYNIDEVANKALASSDHISFMDKLALLTGRRSQNYELTFTIDEEAILQYVDAFISAHSNAGQNAALSVVKRGEIQLLPSQDKVIWHKQELIDDIHQLLAKRLSIDIDLSAYQSAVSPAITSEALSSVNSLVSSYSTTFSPSSDSAANIILAAKNISNTLLMPGEVFSFNKIIGNTTLEKGYVYAPIIVNAQYVQGVGGGICQVSSTLYNAILLSGLTASERRPHSKPSSYVLKGMDATIDWGTIDFKFKNTLPYPIYIVAETYQSTLRIDIYSNEQVKENTYKFSSDVYETLSSPIRFVDDATLEKGTTILSSQGTEGYKVRVTRKTYHSGELVETKLISSDVYQPTPTIYKRGTR